MIIKPDKGNAVVILDKINYVSKMDDILQDSDKFVLINEDWFKVIIQHEEDFFQVYFRTQ